MKLPKPLPETELDSNQSNFFTILFIRFLRFNDVDSTLIEERIKEYGKYESFQDAKEKESYDCWIAGFFKWDDTDEDFEYWNELYKSWLETLGKIK